jgi:hypothetical protein
VGLVGFGGFAGAPFIDFVTPSFCHFPREEMKIPTETHQTH